MVLGPQFENTYWFEKPEIENHTKVVFSSKDSSGDDDPFKPDDLGAPRMAHGHYTPEEYRQLSAGAPDNPYRQESAHVDHQGMLFSPYVGTGLKDDPMVPLERRQQTAERALGFLNKNGERDVPAYQRRASRAFSSPVSERAAHRDMDLMRDALVNVNMPIQEMEKVYSRAVRDQKRGRAWAMPSSGLIRMTRSQVGSWEKVPARTETVSDPSKTPIHNPKFWSWYDNLTNSGDFSYDMDVALTRTPHEKISWHNPETGETLTGTEPWDRFKDDKGGDVAIRVVESLRKQGFHPNLFPGKAKGSKKHAGIDHQLTVGYNFQTDRYKSRAMHYRFEPGETHTVEVPETEKYVKKEVVNARTLTHEIGHTRDGDATQNYSYPIGHPDPLMEGLADGYADRYHKPRLDSFFASDAYDPTSGRATGNAYGADYSTFKGGKAGRAIYTAIRSHVAQRGIKGAPDVADVYKAVRSKGVDFEPTGGRMPGDWRNHPTREFLGHIWENYPHVRQHLENAGYGDVARKAHADWQELLATHDPKHEQLSFGI